MARILLVDDDIAEITAVKRLVARTAHRAQLATTAADASGAIERDPPDLLVVASRCDGGQALSVIGEAAADAATSAVPVIVLGDAPGLPPRVRSLALPIDPELLGREIERLLEASSVASSEGLPPTRPLVPAPPVAPVPTSAHVVDSSIRRADGAEDPRGWADELAGPAAELAAQTRTVVEAEQGGDRSAPTARSAAAPRRDGASVAVERRAAAERREAPARRPRADEDARRRAEADEEERLRAAIASARAELEVMRRRQAPAVQPTCPPPSPSSSREAPAATSPVTAERSPRIDLPQYAATVARDDLVTAPTVPEVASRDPAPSDPAPSDPAPSDPAPSDPAPSDPAPSDPAPSDPAPSDPAPPEAAPPDRAPPSSAPSDAAPPALAPPGAAPPEAAAPAPDVPEPVASRTERREPGRPTPQPASPAPTPPAPAPPSSRSPPPVAPPRIAAPSLAAPAPPRVTPPPVPTIPPPPDELRAGTLSELPAPRLLALAARARLAGRLDLEGEVQRSLWFEGGRVVGAISADPAERIEALAVRLGLVTRDQHQQVAAQAASLPARRAALLLLDAGFLKPAELGGLVRRRTEEIVFGTFGDAGARFRWVADEVPADERAAVERPPLALAVEGVRRRWSAPRLDPVLGGPDTLLNAVPDGPPADALALSPEERQVAALADGLRTVHEIERASPLGALATRQVLVALVQVGVLDVGRLAVRASPEATREIDLARLADKLDQARRSDYFTVLGLSRSSTSHEVREAAARLEEALEPGRLGGAAGEVLAGMTELLQVVRDAREVLGDDRLRQAYLSALGD